MKVLGVIITLALCTTTGCLVNPKSAPQDLRHVRGTDLSPLQLQQNMRIKQMSAKKVLKNNGCASLLEKPAWKGTEAGNGFYSYRLKKKEWIRKGVSCKQQFLSVDLQAIFYMAQHGISCSTDKRGLLQLNIPKDNGHDVIKADCKTRLIDLNFYNNALRVATFEDNGSTYLASIDKQGNLGSGMLHAVEGVSPKKLAELKKLVRETSAMYNLSGKPTKIVIAGTSAAITGVSGFIYAGSLAASSTASAATVAVASAAAGLGGFAVTFVAVSVGLGIAVGVIGGAITQAHQTYLEVVPALRTMIRLRLNGSKVIDLYEEPQEPMPQQPIPYPT